VDVDETSFLEPILQHWSGPVGCTCLFSHRTEAIQPPLQGSIFCQGAILRIVIEIKISELDPPSGFDIPGEPDKSRAIECCDRISGNYLLETLAHESWPVSYRIGQVSRVDEIEWVTEGPGFLYIFHLPDKLAGTCRLKSAED
jgi:hypothetical protein